MAHVQHLLHDRDGGALIFYSRLAMVLAVHPEFVLVSPPFPPCPPPLPFALPFFTPSHSSISFCHPSVSSPRPLGTVVRQRPPDTSITDHHPYAFLGPPALHHGDINSPWLASHSWAPGFLGSMAVFCRVGSSMRHLAAPSQVQCNTWLPLLELFNVMKRSMVTV